MFAKYFHLLPSLSHHPYFTVFLIFRSVAWGQMRGCQLHTYSQIPGWLNHIIFIFFCNSANLWNSISKVICEQQHSQVAVIRSKHKICLLHILFAELSLWYLVISWAINCANKMLFLFPMNRGMWVWEMRTRFLVPPFFWYGFLWCASSKNIAIFLEYVCYSVASG